MCRARSGVVVSVFVGGVFWCGFFSMEHGVVMHYHQTLSSGGEKINEIQWL